MRKDILLFAALLLTAILCMALVKCNPEPKPYNYAVDLDKDTTHDFGSAIVVATDGSVVIAGASSNDGVFSDFAMVRFKQNAEGTISLQTRIDHKDGVDRSFDDLRITDTGFIATGIEYSPADQYSSATVARFDKDLNPVWSQNYNFSGRNASGLAIIQTYDGNFAITGKSSLVAGGDNDCLLFKINKEGEVLWQIDLGEEGIEDCYDLIELGDGSLLLTGWTTSGDLGGLLSRLLLIHTDAEGQPMTLPFPPDLPETNCEIGEALVQTQDGNIFVVGGAYNNTDFAYDVCVWKLNEKLEFVDFFILDLGGFDVAYDIKENEEGNLVLTGSTTVGSSVLNQEMFLVSISQMGELLWERHYKGYGVGIGTSLDIDQWGNIEITGATHASADGAERDIWILRTDPEGMTSAETITIEGTL